MSSQIYKYALVEVLLDDYDHPYLYRGISYGIGAIQGFLSIYMIYSMVLTWRKYKLITNINSFEAYDKTYCLMSKLLVQMILFGTPFCVIALIHNTIIFCQPYSGKKITRQDVGLEYSKLYIAPLITLCDLLSFVQAFEWQVMILLIMTEFKKTTDVIWDANIKRECKRVRQKEKCYKRLFYMILVLVTLDYYVLIFMKEIVGRDNLYSVQIVCQAALFAYEIIMFIIIYTLLIKYHHYEFQRNKDSMRLRFATTLVYHLSMILPLVLLRYYEKTKDSKQLYGILYLWIPPLLFILQFIALINIKSHIDILQGISKLDYLVKVSVFQIYKNDQIQRQKDKIGDSDVLIETFIQGSAEIDRDLNSQHFIRFTENQSLSLES